MLEELVSLVLQENLVYIYFFLGNSYSFTQPILAEAALWVDLLHFRNADQDYIGYYKDQLYGKYSAHGYSMPSLLLLEFLFGVVSGF